MDKLVSPRQVDHSMLMNQPPPMMEIGNRDDLVNTASNNMSSIPTKTITAKTMMEETNDHNIENNNINPNQMNRIDELHEHNLEQEQSDSLTDRMNTITIVDDKTLNNNNNNNPIPPCQTPSLDEISPSTLEALKTLSNISSYSGLETITDCDKLRASLEQIRAKKNMKLFNKLDKIRQDFSGLNYKLAQMEESILDLKKGTRNFVKSLPQGGKR